MAAHWWQYHEAKGCVLLSVKVTPKARQAGLFLAESAEAPLGVKIHAVAEDGKANAAVIALLAKTLKLPKGAFRIEHGDCQRYKTIAIAGDAAVLLPKLEGLMAQLLPKEG